MRRPLVLLVAIVVGCSTVDGTPVDLTGVSGLACANDLECGPGRHCQAGTCAIECSVARDCGPGRDCSSCGTCVKLGQRYDACLPASDRPCVSDGDCSASIAPDWTCGADKICQRKCKDDVACTEIGRGFGCVDGTCVRRCISDERCFIHGFKWTCKLPPGVDPIVNDEAKDPVFGTCIADPKRIEFATPTPDDPPAAFVQGVYGMLLAASVRTQGIPLIGRVDTVSIQHLLVRMTRDGSAIAIEQKWCDTELRNFLEDDSPLAIEAFKVVLPDRNLDAIRVVRSRIEIVPALTTGATFVTTEQIHLRGARLAKPATDPLPTYKDLTNQWDQDRDGLPGMTAKVTGALSGDLYQAQRWKPTFEGMVVDADHLQGLAKGSTDQTILGATNALLVNDSYSTEHPQSDRSYFRLVRMRNDASCADVSRLATVEGGWLAFTPHYDPAARPK